MTILISKCFSCRHYQENWRCAAFPDEIPDDILFNKFDHTKPYEGDNGIMFEPIEEEAREE